MLKSVSTSAEVSQEQRKMTFGGNYAFACIPLIPFVVPGTFLTTTRGEMTTSKLLMMTTLAFVAAFQGYNDADET